MATKNSHKKVDKKKRKISWPFIIFGVIGAIIFFLPSIYSAWTSYNQGQDLVKYEKTLPIDPENIKQMKKYNKYVKEWQGHVSTESLINKAAKDLDLHGGDVMGYLAIPAIKLKAMPIAYGDTDKILSKGLGTLPFTSLPVGGKNSLATITGHSGMSNQIFFDNIKFLKKGDKIHLTMFGYKYDYVVTKKKVIDPNKEGADRNFFVQDGKDMIALMTCTPVFVNSHRLIVYAKRVKVTPDNAKTIPYRAFWSVEHIYFIIVGLLLLIIALAIWRLERRHKKNVQKKQAAKKRRQKAWSEGS